jgi:two-component system sensor histidine kinase QseC
VLTLFVVSWGVVAGFAFYKAEEEIEEVFDAELSQSAQVLIGIIIPGLGQWDHTISLDDDLVGHIYETKISFQVWRDSELLVRSATAPDLPLARVEGYSDQIIDGRKWRVFTQFDSRTSSEIHVAELYEIRNELVEYIALGVIAPMFFALPILALLFWVAITRGLAPLSKAAKDVSKSSPEEISVLPEDVPNEIKPLVGAINNLLMRIKTTLDRERRFTADAAHELRTPLASLRIQSQVALRAKDDKEQKNALQQIIFGVDRATRMVEQLLTLARLEPLHEAESGFKNISLATVATEVVSDLANIAHGKSIDISMDVHQDDVRIRANPVMLSILLRNLVDNAIRYTPPGGDVKVMIEHKNEVEQLVVEDSGPGVVKWEKDHIFNRFFRGGNSGNSMGCGLGLSIVQRVAEIHNAKIILGVPSSGKGLRITVDFEVV